MSDFNEKSLINLVVPPSAEVFLKTMIRIPVISQQIHLGKWFKISDGKTVNPALRKIKCKPVS